MIKNFIELLGNILEYIYDFLFDWEDDPYEEQEFLRKEKLKHSLVKAENKKIDAIREDFELIQDTFGSGAADYLYSLKQEVSYLVEKHGLVKENTIKAVIPPEKIQMGNLKPAIFEETIEGIYSQYNRDVILKPGKINLISTGSGKVFAEMEIESYSVNQALLNTV